MLGLALDSAGSLASAALWRGKVEGETEPKHLPETSSPEILGYKELSPEIGKADQLILVVEQLLLAVDLAYQDLDVIAVNCGPGSFTGIRSAVALARGLALATGRPTIGVTSQEALAARIGVDEPPLAQEDQQRSLMIAEDARRGQVYCQSFRPDLKPHTDPRAEAPETVASLLSSGRWRLAGSGVASVQGNLNDTADVTIVQGTSLSAEGVAIAAFRRLMSGEAPNAGFDLVPLYIRGPDAIKPKPLVSPVPQSVGA